MNTSRIRPLLFLTLVLAIIPLSPARSQSLAERTNRGLVAVITGNIDTTALRMVADIADLLDDGSTRRILPVVGKGSFQNVTDLRALRGIDLAVVQTDVLEEARRKDLSPNLEASVSYIARLHNEELHFLARSAIHELSDLSGKKVNVGVSGDGTAITASAIFNLVKLRVEPTTYDPAEAIAKLRAGEIAAVAVVTGKPAAYFRALRREDDLHFIAIPLTSDVVAKYAPARLTADDYPGLIDAAEPIDTIAVGSALLVANLTPGSERYRNVVQFVDAFFTQFPRFLEAPRHAKWREIDLASELPGWRRFPAAEAWLKRNVASTSKPNEQQLREIFARFIDERSRATTGKAMTPEEKDVLFDQFTQWQHSQTH